MTTDTRCTSMVPMQSGWYRCTYETGDGHTEHHYNYFRSLTKREREIYKLPLPDDDDDYDSDGALD